MAKARSMAASLDVAAGVDVLDLEVVVVLADALSAAAGVTVALQARSATTPPATSVAARRGLAILLIVAFMCGSSALFGLWRPGCRRSSIHLQPRERR